MQQFCVFVALKDKIIASFFFSFQFLSQQREIDDHKEEIKKYQGDVAKLNAEKEKMKKDIQGLRKEIVERDDTIQDKVSCNHLAMLLLYSGKFSRTKIFRDLKVKVCEIIFAIFIFAISNEPTFEFLLE